MFVPVVSTCVWAWILYCNGCNFDNNPVCVVNPWTIVCGCLCLYACVSMNLCVCVCVCKMRGLLRPLGDRGSNEDVWLFQHPSADIFLPSFTPVYQQHLSTHIHSNSNPPYAIISSIIAFSQSWHIRGVLGIQSCICLRFIVALTKEVKTVGLLSSWCPNSALPVGYLDMDLVWFQVFKHKKGSIIIQFLHWDC